MGRKKETKNLRVWMNGEPVGTWTVEHGGNYSFKYDESWLTSEHAKPISLSLPLAPETHRYNGDRVFSFFDNLLPDSADIRKRIRNRYQADSLSPFDLLKEIGRDCVGAIQLLPPDELPNSTDEIMGRDITEQEVARILKAITENQFFQDSYQDEFRISLAGAQEKTALLFHNDTWKIPHGTTPTTHIIKLPLGTVGSIEADVSLSVENEWLCSKLISAFGLKTAHCEIAEFADMKALVVQRFDRNMHTGKIVRLLQEDFCQITGTSPHSKYESEGGPGIRTIMNILLGSTSSLSDRIDFFKSQIIFWLLAAPDGHAKNYSVFIRDAGRFQLTPIYDVISAYPVLGHGKNLIAPQRLNMAMAFTGKKKHYKWNKILPRHIVQTGNMCGLETRDVLEQVLTEVPRVLDHVSSLLPQGFPALVSDSILSGVQQQAEEAVKTL